MFHVLLLFSCTLPVATEFVKGNGYLYIGGEEQSDTEDTAIEDSAIEDTAIEDTATEDTGE